MSQKPIDPTPPNSPAKDVEGEDVKVEKKQTQRPGEKAEAVDRAITPTSIKTKEQEAEKIEKASEQARRKLDE